MTGSVSLGAVLERLAARDLLAAPAAEAPAATLHGVRTDSRRVRPGDLFCAIRGTAGDGHLHLAAAAARGAVAALVEDPVPPVSLPQIRVRDGRTAAAYAAAAVWRDPWDDLALLGVTGTNGKTTTAAILRHLLACRAPAGSVGTLGVVGAAGRVLPGTEGLTTPGPAEAAEWLRLLHDGGVRAVAMEASSHALDQHRLAAVRFDVGVFTNLSRDHLDYHGTPEAYRDAKLRLLRLLKPGGAAVVNTDDPAWAGVAAPPGRRTVGYGLAPGAEVSALDIAPDRGGTTWTLQTRDGAARTHTPLLGAFNLANALAAAAALWALGWKAREVADGLADAPQVPGRLESVPTPPGAAAVVIDYAHTPDALERALGALRPLTPGRLVVVFGAGGDRDRGKRPAMGEAVASGADLAILTSDNPRREDPARIADDVEAGMGAAPRLRVLDRREAIRRALREAGPGDLVLLAGKGHETYQIRGEERHPFDEREVVRELLAEVGTVPA